MKLLKMKFYLSCIFLCSLVFNSTYGQTILWTYFLKDSNSDRVAQRVILIGDAGEPAENIRATAMHRKRGYTYPANREGSAKVQRRVLSAPFH